MYNINNTLNFKILYYLFFSINFILIIGLVNSSWISLFAWLIFLICIYSSDMILNKKRWILIIVISLCSIGIKTICKTPYITEGSNVFIGGNFDNSIFKKKIPAVIYNHLQTDFVKQFPENLSDPSKYLFDNSVSKLINKTSESRLVKTINWRNRNALQLSAFNNTKYNAYGEQQPERNKLPFFIKYTFPSDFKDKNSELCWKGQAYLELEEYI